MTSSKAGTTVDDLCIDLQVVLSHAPRTEPLLENRTALRAIDPSHSANRLDGFVHVVDDKASSPIQHDLWNRSARKGHYGRTHRHRFDHYQPEWLGPVDGKQRCVSIAQERLLLRLVDFAYVL